MNQKRILFFGAGEQQESIIKNAKEMGLYNVGIDQNLGASAKDHLDEFYVWSEKDFHNSIPESNYVTDNLITLHMHVSLFRDYFDIIVNNFQGLFVNEKIYF